MSEEERKLMIQIANSLQALQKEVVDIKQLPTRTSVISPLLLAGQHPVPSPSLISEISQDKADGHINAEIDIMNPSASFEERKKEVGCFLDEFKELINRLKIKKINIKYVRPIL